MVLFHIIYLNMAKHTTEIFIYLNSLPQDFFFFYHFLPSDFTLTEKLFPFTLIPVSVFLSITPNFCLSSYCSINFVRIKSGLLMSILLLFHTVHGVLNARILSSVQFSRSAVSDSLRPHELQHARPPCPSPAPRVHSYHIHRVIDAIQPSHPLSSPSPPAPDPSQHQSLFQ